MAETVRRPRQNRVDPWGGIHATPARGTLMGNRGCLHDEAGTIVRQHQGRRWILCRLAFRGRRRVLMAPGRYTELFFLDEATGLAAGHRPCAECQRQRYALFLYLWTVANGLPAAGAPPVRPLPAAALDAALHGERLVDGRKRTYRSTLADLPPGTLVAMAGEPYLVGLAQLWRWTYAGYLPGPPWDGMLAVDVLTPRSVMCTLAAGYPVQVHASAGFPARTEAPDCRALALE